MRTLLLVFLLLVAPTSWAQNDTNQADTSTETGLEGTTPLTSEDAVPLDEVPSDAATAAPTSETVSEAMLASFVKSLLEIQPLLEEASAALLATDSDTERQALEEDFENQAIAIIDTNALSVDDYRRLISLANSDETFTQRVAAEIDRQQALASPAPSETTDDTAADETVAPEASPSPTTAP